MCGSAVEQLKILSQTALKNHYFYFYTLVVLNTLVFNFYSSKKLDLYFNF